MENIFSSDGATLFLGLGSEDEEGKSVDVKDEYLICSVFVNLHIILRN